MSNQTLVHIDSDIEDVNEGSIDSLVNVSISDYEDKAIGDFTAFSEIIRNTDRTKYVHLKVKRIGRSSCCNYHHHFILIEIVHQDRNQIKVIVAHYTSSEEILANSSRLGIGKFISVPIVIERDTQNDLFDFKSGLFLVAHPISTDTFEIRQRFYQRLGEKIYDFGANNCEHAVNQILTGNALSNEANSRQSCADICTYVFGEFKEVGLKVALIIALVTSMEGSLTRYSYVRLIIAGVAAYISKIGGNGTCSNLLGNNIIGEADNVLDKYKDIPYFSEISSGEQIISEIKASLNNPLLCRISEKLAWEALCKTFLVSLIVSWSVETIFVITKLFFVYPSLYNILTTRTLMRMIFVRLVAGYISIPLSIVLGSLGQAFLSPPALYFSLFTFIGSIILRYVISLVAGIIFDKCCRCFCRCNSCRCCCRTTLKRCYFALFLYLLCIVGIGLPLSFYLD